MAEDFHTGKRLVIARKLRGFTQESILGEPGFPPVNVKTLRRWEQAGINPTRLEEVARFFNTEIWAFTEARLSEEDFSSLISFPELIGQYKQRYSGKESPSSPEADPLKHRFTQAYLKLAAQDHLGLKELLTQAPFPTDYPDEQGWTLLFWAAHLGALNGLNLLLDLGAQVDLSDPEGLTPLHCAAARNHEAVVARLLEAGAPLNQCDAQGWSPVTWTTANRLPRLLKRLLDFGGQADLPDQQGITPLLHALRHNFPDVGGILLSQGADPNAKSPSGVPLLLVAIEQNNLKFVELLREAGANPNAQGPDGRSARKVALAECPAALELL